MKLKKKSKFVIGCDFGSDSVRVVLLDAADGEACGTCVSYYPRWKQGLYCKPQSDQFRQHPLDYLDSLTEAVRGAVAQSEQKYAGCSSKVCGICIDTTGSTPVLADKNGTPLALTKGFEEDPDAMFILWKDHTAVAEAAEINELSAKWGGVNYTKYCGGVYSSEWFWAKLLHTIRRNRKVASASVSAVEHCDWITAVLCANTSPATIRRSRCAAGHKAMWHKEWGGYPDSAFLNKLDPKLTELAKSLGTETWTTEQVQGKLTSEWASKLGLPEGISVCVGAFDAHIGAVGGDAADGVMVKSIGTSTCDIIMGPLPPAGTEKPVSGICGQVDGSVVAGFMGYEAGQSAYGDYYAWFRNLLMWPLKNIAAQKGIGSAANLSDEELEAFEKNVLRTLEDAAGSIEPSENAPVALDWINGRRTPYANQMLSAMMSGLKLGSDASACMRMLLESTAYGARAIIECFEKGGIHIKKIMAIGGVARKSTLGMQILADVTNREITVTASDQSCAIGAAVFAATAAGLYPSVMEAQKALSAGAARVHKPNPKNVAIYNKLYDKYLRMGAFAEGELSK